MDADADVASLIASIETVPVASMLTDLPTRTFIVVNALAAELFGEAPEALVGRDVISHIHPDDRAAAQAAYEAMAGGIIDGYQVKRRIDRGDGTTATLNVWGRRVSRDPPIGLWMLTPDGPAGAVASALGLTLAITDHDWRLQYVCANAAVLGDRSDLIGEPLLGLVHPLAAPDFVAAATTAVANDDAVTILTRLRSKTQQWIERYCLLAPMCQHDPPRLGVVITAGPSLEFDVPADALPNHARHAAIEARALDALQALPALTRYSNAPDLSTRQVEVLAKLIEGANSDEIARSLYLSASTVRNHLTAIYRKFGVQSRGALLARLLRESAPNND